MGGSEFWFAKVDAGATQDGGTMGLSAGVIFMCVGFDFFDSSAATYDGHFRKFAVWGPPQLQHFGVSSGVFAQLLVSWSPPHLTHLGACPQWEEEWPKPWHAKH